MECCRDLTIHDMGWSSLDIWHLLLSIVYAFICNVVKFLQFTNHDIVWVTIPYAFKGLEVKLMRISKYMFLNVSYV